MSSPRLGITAAEQDHGPALASVLDGLPAAIYATDSEGRIVFFNRAAAEMWGHEPVIGVTRWCGAWKLYTDDGEPLPHELCPMAVALRERRAIRGAEGIVERPDGSRVPFLPFPTPLFSANGDLIGAVNLLIDISARKAADAKLAESEEHYRLIVENCPTELWVAAADGTLQESGWRKSVNTGAFSGLETDFWLEHLHPDDRARAAAAWARAVATGSQYDIEYRQWSNGRYRWYRARARAVLGPNGAIQRWYGSNVDIDDAKRADVALREVEERYRLAAKASGDGIWDWDLVADELTWGESIEEMFGYPGQMRTSISWWVDQIHPDDRERVDRGIHAVIDAGEANWSDEYRFRKADGDYADILDRGHLIRDVEGRPLRMVGAMLDLTARKRGEAHIRWLATHDPLTALPNRTQFQERLAAMIASAEEYEGKIGMLLLDVDDFKEVNDRFGHHTGDALLRDFGERLRRVVRGVDVVARLGGDEFAVLLMDTGDPEALAAAADGILERLRQPFAHEGRAIDCRASIGGSLYPLHGRDADELLRHADIALYASKAAGRGQFHLFRSAMRAEMQARAEMIGLARTAIGEESIRPFYQPKVNLQTGRLAGFEALLRWRDEQGRIQAPATIAAGFAHHDLAVEIGDHMAAAVVADMRRWLDQGLDFGRIAINAAAAEFRRDDFAERLLERLARANVPTSRVELEVTESVFLGQGAEGVGRALRTLSAEGVTIALDDFGTGYASLSHLKQFPVDVIKIDRSFVADIHSDADDAAIVRAVINLGRDLGVGVVAEGVETVEQADWLRARGCEMCQGYLFGRAMPAREIAGLITAWGQAGPAQAA